MQNNIYTIGFTKKSAEEFFDLLIKNDIDLLLDIRLNNKSQLAGFAKGRDLQYFCRVIANIKYKHDLLFAPTKELLDGYKKKHIQWDEYVDIYKRLMNEREYSIRYISEYKNRGLNICLLCSESEADQCHRRLLAEFISEDCGELSIIHL